MSPCRLFGGPGAAVRGLVEPAACPCCASPKEDEEHILFGCTVTGTVDWLLLLGEVWAKAATESKTVVAS